MVDHDEHPLETREVYGYGQGYNLGGAACFSVGSIGFIWSSWTENWLLPLQCACGIWIAGCLLFLQPFVIRQLRPNCSCSRSDFCQSSCLLLFLVGCALAFGLEEDVLRKMGSINVLFLTGSILLLVDVLLTLLVERDQKPGVMDSIIAVSFVYAACLGGYGKEISVVRAGMFGWAVGSIASAVDPARRIFCQSNRALSAHSESALASYQKESALSQPIEPEAQTDGGIIGLDIPFPEAESIQTDIPDTLLTIRRGEGSREIVNCELPVLVR
jgi:hypothetical protein